MFQLYTDLSNGDVEVGQVALTAEGMSLISNIEYGVTDTLPCMSDIDMDIVDILSMTESDIENLSAEVENALMMLLINAMEEVPALAEMLESL